MRLLGRLLRLALSALLGAGLLAAARARPAADDHTAPDPPPGLPPARTISLPGHGELWVRDAGEADAPPVVLLHGWMFPADLNWFLCYGPLAEQHRVLAPDARGHGRGTRPASPFRLTDVADDVAALLRHLGVGRAVLVGYSMGGAVAQLVARRHPDVVRGLVLCATAAHYPYWVWRGMGLLQLVLRLLPRQWWERATIAQAEGRSPVQLSRMLTPDVPAQVRSRLPWMIGELARGSAEDLAEGGRELGRFDSRAWVGELDVPAAVLITAQDRLLRPHLQRELAAVLPDPFVVELDLDHNAVAAGTEEFLAALRKAIAQVSGETTGR